MAEGRPRPAAPGETGQVPRRAAVGGALRRGWIGPTAAVLALLGLPPLLMPNGGTLRVADAPVGAYRVSVYTDPTPPRPDSVDVSVLVVRAGDPTPVPDLHIVVRAAPIGSGGGPAEAGPDEEDARGGSDGPGASREPDRSSGREGAGTRTVRATRDQADDPRYYAAKFAPGREGPWRFDVDVRGPRGEGTVSFDVRLRQPGLLHRPWAVVVLALVPLALLSLWLLRSGAPDAPPDLTPHPPAEG